MLRQSLIHDYQKNGISPNADDTFIFSMWSAYRSAPSFADMLTWFRAGGGQEAEIHTSGHASPRDLRAFTSAMAPKVVVPVHGEVWDGHLDGFGNVKRLSDGEQYAL